MKIYKYNKQYIFKTFIIIQLTLHILIYYRNAQSQTLPATQNVYFLPHAGILLDYSIMNSSSGFTAYQTKELDLHIMWYNSWNLSMYVKENVYTRQRNNAYYYPYRISYYMDYANIFYKFKNSYLGITINHICYNTIDKYERSINTELRWYGIGIKWYSNGMMTGYRYHYNHNHPLLSFNNVHYFFYIGYPLLSKIPEYKYVSTCKLRYDLPLLLYFIPFLQLQIDGLIYTNNDLCINRLLELGCMYISSHITLIPYMSYGIQHDSLYPGVTDTYYSFGIRATSLIEIYNYDLNNYHHKSKDKSSSLHFLAGYSKTFDSDYYNFTTDFAITFHQFIYNDNYVYFSSYLNHSSESKATALYPRFINISLTSGYAHHIAPEYQLSIGYQHYRRHDGNQYRGQTEYYHSIGLWYKYGTYQNMKSNNNIDIMLYSSYNHFLCEILLSYIVAQQNYPYYVILNPKLYYFFSSYQSIQPYAGFEISYFNGKHNNYEYKIEYGIIFDTNIPLILYYSFTRDIDIDIIGGAIDFYHVVGIKFNV